MRLIALLNWYDESTSWLAATVASCAQAGVDHVIATDGAYFLYPDGKPRSGPEQAEAIQYTADACGMGCTIHAPQTLWMGNEVEKRSFMFRLAETVSEPNEDWYLVLDADTVITKVPADLRGRLEQTDLDVAEITACERSDPFETERKADAARVIDWPRESRFAVRSFFRSIPGLTVRTNHFTYVTPDGRVLWGNGTVGDALAPSLNLLDLEIDHRTQLRDKARRELQKDYYDLRESLGVERGACHHCGERAFRMIPFDWQPVESADGKKNYAAGWVEVCADCEPVLDKKNRARLRYLGYDDSRDGPLVMKAVHMDKNRAPAGIR